MAQAVVHRLEVREVHHQQRGGFVRTGQPNELLLQALDEQRAVRQAGEHVVEELVLALLAQLEQLAYRARHDERAEEIHGNRERDARDLDAVAVR